MSLTQDGLAVADGVRGTTTLHEPTSADKAAGAPDVHEDGFWLRSRAGAPQHPAITVTERLDEVAAPEPEPAPAKIQVPQPPLTIPPAASAPAVTE